MSTEIDDTEPAVADSDPIDDITPEEIAEIIAMREEVRRRVYIAFANTEYPGDNAIHVSGESADEVIPFLGKTWQEISLKKDPSPYDGIYFLYGSAFRYFLPTFMIGVLDEVFGSELPPRYFIPPCCPNAIYDWREFASRFVGLSAEQNECVALFLAYYDDDYGPMSQYECVKSFWDNPRFPEESSGNLCALT